jgi:protein HOOK3
LVGRDASKAPDSDDPVLPPKSTNAAVLPPKFSNDLGLAIEQELAQLHRDHELLRKKGADDITRLETLSSRQETLLEILKERDATIESLRNSNNTEEQADYIKSLLNKLSDGENTIEAHEAQAEENRVKIAKYERELARLRPAAIALVEAEDKVKELEIVQEALRKMTNKVHHYEQKLARFSAIEKENATLKEQKQVLESNQKDYDQIHLQNTQMTEENAQYRSAFEAYERTASEAEENQRFLKDTIREKEATIESLNARLAHDERYIAELQESINSHNTGVRSPDSPTGREAGLSLEEELAQSEEQPAPNYDLEISRLKAENQLLKSNTAGTTNATLRADLENAERLRKRLEVQLQELHEKYAIGQEQLNALISTSAGEKLVKILDLLLGFGPLRILTEGFYRNEAISNTRKLWLDATKELATARSKIADLQTELTDRDRQILAAQADCKFFPSMAYVSVVNIFLVSAIGGNDINALNELKRVNELITSSLQNDLLILQGQHKALTTDFELQKSQLLEALLAKDRALAEVVNLHEVMSTNEEILLAKDKANERMKEERARNEVSRRQDEGANEPPKSPRKKLWNMIKRPLSSISPSSNRQSARARPVSTLEAAKHDAELAQALAAMGTPKTSPRRIPLPPSPNAQPPTAISSPNNDNNDLD